MEQWPDFSSAAFGDQNRLKRALEREPSSLNHNQVFGLQEDTTRESINDYDFSQNNLLRGGSGGGLSERIASRGGFNPPRLNTENFRSNNDFSIENSLQYPLTISPGLSPTTLLESPFIYSNPFAQHSPTTGRFPYFPGVNDNAKDEFFDGLGSSFTFPPRSRSSSAFFQDTTEIMPVDFGSYNNISSHQFAEDVKPFSQNIENSNLYGIETVPSGQNNRFDGTTNTGLETVAPVHQEEEEEEEEEEESPVEVMGGAAPADDGYNWRKYGQKLVKGSEYPRSYYKCTSTNCLMKKKVERSREGHITEIIYKGDHNHPKNPPTRRSGMQADGTEQVEQQQQQQRDSTAQWVRCNNNQQQGRSNENNVEEKSTGFDNDSSDTMVMVDRSSTFSNAEDDRGTQGCVSLSYDGQGGGEGDESESKRRKLDTYPQEMSGASRAIREPRVVVQTTSEVDILDDGYRWRKYGQKVVKGNPNPRSYYKCTSNGCVVRKHVERASDDIKAVITTYEGKHNHEVPAARNTSHGGGGNSTGGSQTHHHYNTSHHSDPSRGRFDRHVPLNNQSLFRPFSYPGLPAPLFPPTGFPFGLGQPGLGQPGLGNLPMPSLGNLPMPGLGNLPMPGLPFGQGSFPGLPHSYLPTPIIGMMQRGMEPKVEPGLESEQKTVYNQLMSRLP